MKKGLLNSCFLLLGILSNTLVFSQITKRILLINNYNVQEEHMRKNKKAFFLALSDTLTDRLTAWTLNRGYETVVLKGYTAIDSTGSNLVYDLIRTNQCSLAIVINKFDVYFNIEETEVTRDESGGKSKTAHYNIASLVTYSLFDTGNLIKKQDIIRTTPHSSRSVISGLLAAGPNIMNNKEDAVKILEINVRDYMLDEFKN